VRKYDMRSFSLRAMQSDLVSFWRKYKKFALAEIFEAFVGQERQEGKER
jgi:hypothetical protein